MGHKKIKLSEDLMLIWDSTEIVILRGGKDFLGTQYWNAYERLSRKHQNNTMETVMNLLVEREEVRDGE